MQLRKESGDKWGYLSRRPEEVLTDYPVILTVHRTGNVMGTSGITAMSDRARELGLGRIVEIGKDLARSMKITSGDRLVVLSPYSDKGVPATALVTARVGSFERGQARYHVASLTLYGSDDAGVNSLTPPAFDFLTGGLEIKVFMGRIEKAKM
jgi:anaerobic selenocysteine-containing dehydrogenase